MTYLSINFNKGERYIGNRPFGTVILKGPGGSHGKSLQAIALVDTGADFMHLPDEAATYVGISLANSRVFKVSTAGGIIKVRQQNVNVEIQGVSVNIPVNFSKNAKPLIGRQAIFAILDTAGFSTTEWLLDWPHPPQLSSTISSTTQKQSTIALRQEDIICQDIQDVLVKMGYSPPQSTVVDYGDHISIAGIKIKKKPNHAIKAETTRAQLVPRFPSNIKCQFIAKQKSETSLNKMEGTGRLNHVSIKNTISGDIEAEGILDYLIAYPVLSDGAVPFIGYEYVVGRIGSIEGGFVVKLDGVFSSPYNEVHGKIEILSGSGTGGFTGISGSGVLTAHASKYGGKYSLIIELAP